jgi:hypothetical protein
MISVCSHTQHREQNENFQAACPETPGVAAAHRSASEFQRRLDLAPAAVVRSPIRSTATMKYCLRNSIAAIALGAATGFPVVPTALAAEPARAVVAAATTAGFTELERQMVEQYFGKMPAQTGADETGVESETGADKDGKAGKSAGKKKNPPPGLARRDSLPPGLARQEALPPGLAQRALPADLEEQLPPPPTGYERRIAGDSAVVLIEKATGIVADIIEDILVPPADD